MEEFVKKDIEKTPNSFFYTPKRFISKAEAFSKNVSAFLKESRSCSSLHSQGWIFLFHMIQADYWISFFLCPFNQSGHLFGLLFLWS